MNATRRAGGQTVVVAAADAATNASRAAGDAGDAALQRAASRLPELMRGGILQLTEPPPLALYVHLPWCLRKCPYCDFNSHAGQPDERGYLDALLADLDAALPLIWGRRVLSVFIGGGTPSDSRLTPAPA